MINCPYCGKLTDPKLAACPHCGGPMQPKAPPPPPRSEHRCPTCSAPIQDGDIICVRCGTNLLTGQKITEERKEEAAASARNLRPALLIAGGVLLAICIGLALYLLLQPNAVKRAQDLYREGRGLEAIHLLEEHVEAAPADVEAHRLLAEVRLANGQFLPAADSYETVRRLDPGDLAAGFRAVAALERAPGQAPLNRQATLLRTMTQDHPASERAWFLLALALARSGDSAAAIDAARRAAEIAGPTESAHKTQALAHAMEGDIEAARQHLNRIRDAASADGDIAAAIGAVANLAGDTAESRAYLQQALEQGASVANIARARLGLLLLMEGNPQAAHPLLEQAARGAAPVPEAAFLDSLARYAMGQRAVAMTGLEAVVEQGGTLAAEASALLAALYLDAGNASRARDSLAYARQNNAPRALVETLEGRLQLAEGDESGAQAAFRRAVEADPAYGGARLEMGLLYIRRGAINEGVRELERYLELVQDDPAAVRANEIRVLVQQLRQTTNPGAQAAEQPARAVRR